MSLIHTYEELCAGRTEPVPRMDELEARAANLLAAMALRERRLRARGRGEAPGSWRTSPSERGRPALATDRAERAQSQSAPRPREPRRGAPQQGGYGERNNTRVYRATRVRRAVRRLSPDPSPLGTPPPQAASSSPPQVGRAPAQPQGPLGLGASL